MTAALKAVGSAPADVETPKLIKDFGKADVNAPKALGSNSFTSFWTWRGNGSHVLNFTHGGINANSRVFVSLSEFNSDAAQNRFVGAARMQVANVAPYNGGFFAWVDVAWDNALNVRFDVLVDP